MPGGLVPLTPEKSRPVIELPGITIVEMEIAMPMAGPGDLLVLTRSTRSSLGDGDMLKDSTLACQDRDRVT